ncbi:hypothetical protein GCM10027160_31300 [Streptomyces calidiresistens]|uniref:Uncharacterized protein n=1 Tax=Streptomyces calidiresistens TaxID=1485586 RepID=A0A7W3T3G6_9ACTN|nr:hypothetical protein [Streptomyces calidiresistens]MBB0230217.1 hypothetical protein [Streptomyces calidiresistens]
MFEDFLSRLDGRRRLSLTVVPDEEPAHGEAREYVIAAHEFGYRMTSHRVAPSGAFRLDLVRDDHPAARERARRAADRFRDGCSWLPAPPDPTGYAVHPLRAGEALMALHEHHRWSPRARRATALGIILFLLAAAVWCALDAVWFPWLTLVLLLPPLPVAHWYLHGERRAGEPAREEAAVLRRYEAQWRRDEGATPAGGTARP